MADICDCGQYIEQPATGRRRSKCLTCKPPRVRAKPPPKSPILAAPAPALAPPSTVSGGDVRPTLAEQSRRELAAADRLETHSGVAALMLAELLDKGGYNAQGAASMVKAHREAMAAALAGAKRADDAVDDLRERRRRKAASA